jgi:hypothetical protein
MSEIFISLTSLEYHLNLMEEIMAGIAEVVSHGPIVAAQEDDGREILVTVDNECYTIWEESNGAFLPARQINHGLCTRQTALATLARMGDYELRSYISESRKACLQEAV